ncbi:MAG: hypothetical protein JRI54_07995, partial [Deltaproteobacteria bacterium]|nr:hypothetical protein [Deltaproteobacteria bacterium]
MSHTASIAGSDEVFEAICRQTGIIRTYDVSHAFDLAEALSKQPLPKGNRVAVVSSGGGHCVVTTDACGALGLEVPELDKETVQTLEKYLLPHAPPPTNPIDLAADPRPMTSPISLNCWLRIHASTPSSPWPRCQFGPRIRPIFGKCLQRQRFCQKYLKNMASLSSPRPCAEI